MFHLGENTSGKTLEYVFVCLFFSVFCNGDLPCNRVMKESGHVCVCNATYCDTITPPEQLLPGKFHFYYTSHGSPGFNHETGHFRTQSFFSDGFKYEVNKSKKFQKIRGFGGSFTDSFGFNLNTLSEKAQENLLRSFFSEDGIEYSVGRIVIGSCDFSLRHYTYLPDYDPTLSSFNLTEDDYIYKISPIKKAISISKRHLNFFGSAWNSPNWVKVGDTPYSGFLKHEFRQLWADYYIKTLDAFRSEGIEFWALTTGNEPATIYIVGPAISTGGAGKLFSVLLMFPEEQRDWVINNLGPALENANYSTDIIVLDDMRVYATWWMDSIMRDKRAEKYVSGIGLHYYFDVYSSLETLDILHEKYPNQEIVYTESSINVLMNLVDENLTTSGGANKEPLKNSSRKGPLLGSWSRGAYYALNIIENLNHWMTTYVDWNLALNEDGGPILIDYPCDASIIVNSTSNEFYKQPMFYIMGHFSKFIHPDAVIIGVNYLNNTKNSSRLMSEDIHYIGALNPNGSIAVVFYNPKSSYTKIEVNDPNTGYASLILEPKSLSTLLYW